MRRTGRLLIVEQGARGPTIGARIAQEIQDLLDRLSFEVLFIPPLRARGEDIILLAQHFASRMAYELGRDEIPEFSGDVVEAMLSYDWPGNVRELKNTVERAVYRTRNSLIEGISLNPFDNPYMKSDSGAGESQDSFGELFDSISLNKYSEAGEMLGISFLQRALDICDGSQKEAAAKLGLTYDQFRGLYRKYKEKLRK